MIDWKDKSCTSLGINTVRRAPRAVLPSSVNIV